MTPKQYVANLTPEQYNKHISHATKFSRSENGYDIAHNAFIKLIPSEKEVENIKSYTGMAIMNRARLYAGQKCYRHYHAEYTELDCEDGFYSVFATLKMTNDAYQLYHVDNHVADETRNMYEAIKQLSPMQKKVIEEFLNGLDLKEISLKYAMNYNTVKATYLQSTHKLRDIMQKQA